MSGEVPALASPAVQEQGLSSVKAEDEAGAWKQECGLQGDPQSQEVLRQRFRKFGYSDFPGPREALNRLQQLCRQWLRPERRSKEQILELLVLEQFVAILPEELRAWVQERGPGSGEEAVTLLEKLEREFDEPWPQDTARDPELTCEEVTPVTDLLQPLEPQAFHSRDPAYKMPTAQVLTAKPDTSERVAPVAKSSPGRGAGETPAGQSVEEAADGLDEGEKQRGSATGKTGSPLSSQEKCFSPATFSKTTDQSIIECNEAEGILSLNLNDTTQPRSHIGKLLYECVDCGKAFCHRSKLIRHQRSHTGERPYACKECGKAFGFRTDLVRHQRIHSGEKPYKCYDCGKAFRGSSELIRHRRTHTGEKPYSCGECGKAFSQSSSLIQHKKIHTGDKGCGCTECGKTFGRSSVLIEHQRIHAGEKPYECNECRKIFRHRSGLMQHQRTHVRIQLSV